MKDRLKEVRKLSPYGKNQESFANYLGISQSNLASYETGRRTPSDAVVQLICQKCGVCEEWLRTGEGESTIKRTRNQEIAEFANNVMELSDDDIKKKLILAISKLTDDDWKRIIEIAKEVFEEKQ